MPPVKLSIGCQSKPTKDYIHWANAADRNGNNAELINKVTSEINRRPEKSLSKHETQREMMMGPLQCSWRLSIGD